MIRRPLVIALAAAVSLSALLPATASAEDLLQTYELARTADPQLAAAESNRLAIQEGAVQTRAAMLPQLDGSASITKGRSYQRGNGSINPDGTINTGDSDSESTTRSSGVNLSQMVYDRGNFTRHKSAKALAQAADFQLAASGNDLITRTSASYFNVLIALESLAAAEAAETALKKQFDYASKRLEVGLAPITDVHEARAEYDQARANTILARNNLKDYYQALTELTGQPVMSLRALPEAWRPEVPAQYSNVDELVSSAITENPALKAQGLQVSAAESSVSAARAGHYPTLTLGGSWGKSAQWGDSTGSGGLTPDATTNSIGLTLSVPIFSGGATQSRVRQALASRDIQQDTFEQQKRALDRNTRNAYQTVVAGVSEVEARRLAVVSAQAAFDASQVGLEVGTRTVLDVVQNQRTLFAAQVDYVRARYNFLQNRLLLAQATGKLEIADLQDINRMLTDDAEAKLQRADDTLKQ